MPLSISCYQLHMHCNKTVYVSPKEAAQKVRAVTQKKRKEESGQLTRKKSAKERQGGDQVHRKVDETATGQSWGVAGVPAT